MATITLTEGDARQVATSGDLIFTDPPFEMSTADLLGALANVDSDQLVLICTMRQLIGVASRSDWNLNFDFVLNAGSPRKSMSQRAPHYVHQTGAYLTRGSAKSLFSRNARQRSDVFKLGYWPTIIHAPRERSQDHGMAKSAAVFTDILGSFDARSVVDPFAGSGTVGLAAFELGLDCQMVELKTENCKLIRDQFRFLGVRV